MRKIYIVLTHTGTALSRMIKWFTKDEFTHVSIALDVELKKMYSFGRLHPYNPFAGGFVHEAVDSGTFKRFYKTRAKVYSLEVTGEQYEQLSKNIKEFEEKKEDYTFNRLGLFAVGLHRKIQKEHAFYCAEFVKYVIEKAGIETGLPDIIKPEDFKKIEGLHQIYDGILRKYPSPKMKVRELISNNLLIYRGKEGMI